jgi:outer membrane protein assembly factor BamD
MRYVATLVVALALALPVAAQRTSIANPVDPELEKFAAHNLDVGRQYYKRKAYTGVVDRLEEILAQYPEFTKLDEVLFLLGASYAKLDKRDLARKTYQRLVDERPESSFAKRAKEELGKLGEP